MRKKLFLLVLVLTIVSIASVASADTLAYWRFEPGEPDIDFSQNPYPAVPDSDLRAVWRRAAYDWSGKGNHLTGFEYSWAGHDFSTDIPGTPVPLTGASNAQSIHHAGSYPAMMTWTAAHAGEVAYDIELITPLTWSVEASFKADSWDWAHTIVGRDGYGANPTVPQKAPFYFSVRRFSGAGSQVAAVEYTDLAGITHEAISGLGLLQVGTWYNMAATTDGSLLDLYLNGVLVAQTDLTTSGSTDLRMAIGTGSSGDNYAGTWSVGRGMWNGGHGDRWWGNIDEVRISDVALNPSQFLFIPEPVTMALLGLGSLALIRRRKS